MDRSTLRHGPLELLCDLLEVSHVREDAQHLLAHHARQLVRHRFIDDVSQLVE